MNIEGYETISNTPSSEDTEPTASAAEKMDGQNSDSATIIRLHRPHLPQVEKLLKNSSLCATEYASRRTMKARSLTSDFITGIEYRTKFMREIKYENIPYWTTQDRIHRTRLSQVDVTRREKSVPCVSEHASRRRVKARSLTSDDEKPRYFITGIEYKTKFMRETPRSAGQKSRSSSGARNLQRTTADTRTLSRWRPNRENVCLVKQPTRKEDAKKSTSEVGPNHKRPLPNRKRPQFNKSTAEVRTRHATSHSEFKSKNSGKSKPTFDAKNAPDTIESGEMPIYRKQSRAATPSCDATKTEMNLIHCEEIKTSFKMNETFPTSLDLDEKNDSTEPQGSVKFLNAINKADLLINLPNSPTSEPRGSNSLHTTPRSPRLDQKNPSNLFQYSAISETLSPLPGNSVLCAETLEMQRASSPKGTIICSHKRHGPSKKYKFFRSSDNTLTTKTWESVANLPRKKTSTTKQEPMTFTTQLLPLLRWTDKTNPQGLFETHALDGSHSQLNSTANQDDASNDKSHEHKLSKDAASTNSNAVQIEGNFKQPHIATNEDCDIHQSLTDIPGEGEKMTTVTISRITSMTQDENPPTDTDRSNSTNHLLVVKKVLNDTGPQLAVSGCELCPVTSSQLSRRPQSMKAVMMTKQSAVYTRSAIKPLSDFSRRPVSAGIKGKIRSATVSKKPVWK